MTAAYEGTNIKVKRLAYYHKRSTLEYGIDVGQGISVGHSINIGHQNFNSFLHQSRHCCHFFFLLQNLINVGTSIRP